MEAQREVEVETHKRRWGVGVRETRRKVEDRGGKLYSRVEVVVGRSWRRKKKRKPRGEEVKRNLSHDALKATPRLWRIEEVFRVISGKALNKTGKEAILSNKFGKSLGNS